MKTKAFPEKKQILLKYDEKRVLSAKYEQCSLEESISAACYGVQFAQINNVVYTCTYLYFYDK